MINNSKLKLDKKDLKILYELDLNARQSYSQIAKKVGLNKNSVNYRINRMIRENIIQGFYTEIDMYKLGFTLYRIFLRLGNITINKENELIDFFVNYSNTGWVFSVEGNFDLVAGLYFKTNQEYKEFENWLFDKFGNIIENKVVSIFTKMYQLRRGYLIIDKSTQKPYTLIGELSDIKIDNLDNKILQILSMNARLPTYKIANTLDTTPNIIAYRIKNLIKNRIILSSRVMLNLEILGYEWYKIHFKLKNINSGARKKLNNYILSNPFSVYINEAIGGFDFEPEFNVADIRHLRNIIEEMRLNFSDIISDFDVLLYYKTHKIFTYLPIVENSLE